MNSRTTSPVFASHIRTDPSNDAVANVSILGEERYVKCNNVG
jgi:hypothetical protein